MKERTIIYWVQKDLRVRDNPILLDLLNQGVACIPVFVWNKKWDESSLIDFPRMGANRKKFLKESVADFSSTLKQLYGLQLLETSGEPIHELLEICKQNNCQHIITQQAFTTEEENDIKHLQQHKINVEQINTQTLFEEEELPFLLEDIPKVFTQFRKRVEKNSTVTPEQFVKISWPNWDNKFTGGEKIGLSRIDYYFNQSQQVSTYKKTRNGLLGWDFSTKFSPWLATGAISPRTIYAALKKYETTYTANQSTYWVFFELLWREYFYWIAKRYKHRIFLPKGIKNEPLQYKKNTVQDTLFLQWINGNTPSDFVNANMIELKETGYMSNRGRQNVASYLIHDLRIDWRWGAYWFEHTLLDYDAAVNWGNWMYLAGVGNDLRPNRKFNVEKQAEIYDAKASYRKHWL